MPPKDQIYILTDNKTLQPLTAQLYEREEQLQNLLAKHPELLGGSQINPERPIRWLHIKSEAAIADSVEGGARWSVDHLLVDQHGTPTLVEVKRSTDTRIRREVVGQLLEYAANAHAHWPVNRIRELGVKQYGNDESRLEEAVWALLEEDAEGEGDDRGELVERFWQTVDAKLQSGTLRLLFVADTLPSELRRIIEFLNQQMQSVEVLGIEVPQYKGEGLTALAPRVIGQSEATRATKGARTGSGSAGKTDRPSFLSAVGAPRRAFFERILDHAEAQGYVVYWGTKGFSIRAPQPNGKLASFGYGYPTEIRGHDAFDFYLGYIQNEGLRGDLAQSTLKLGTQRRGQHTLMINLEGDGAPSAEAVNAEIDLWAMAIATGAMG